MVTRRAVLRGAGGGLALCASLRPRRADALTEPPPVITWTGWDDYPLLAGHCVRLSFGSGLMGLPRLGGKVIDCVPPCWHESGHFIAKPVRVLVRATAWNTGEQSIEEWLIPAKFCETVPWWDVLLEPGSPRRVS